MLRLPPPIWALIYVLTAAVISWFFDWSKVPGLPIAPLGILLVAISWTGVNGDETISSVTYAGQAMGLLATATSMALYYLVNPPVGTANVRANPPEPRIATMIADRLG